jgi:hypothetical protein
MQLHAVAHGDVDGAAFEIEARIRRREMGRRFRRQVLIGFLAADRRGREDPGGKRDDTQSQ